MSVVFLSSCAGQAGAAGHPDLLREHSNLQRCTWTAQVGVVLHSKVISPVLGYALPPGQSALFNTQLSPLMVLKLSASVDEQAAELNES